MTNRKIKFYNKANIHNFKGYAMKIPDGDFWTSGTDFECPNTYFWCSKETEIVPSEISWKPGHPDASTGDCVHVQIKNGTKDVAPLGISDCSEKKNYICEVRKKGTKGRSLSLECMELWDVSEGTTIKLKFCILIVWLYS